MRHQFQTKICLLLLLLVPGLALADTFTGTGGLTLDAPAGWKTGEKAPGTVLVLLAPQRLATFHPNVNVMIQNAEGVNDQKFKELTDQQIKEIGGRSWDYKAVALPNRVKGRCLNIEFPHQGSKLASLSVWVLKDNRTYLVTGTTTAQDFPTRRAEFLKIAQSLRLPK